MSAALHPAPPVPGKALALLERPLGEAGIDYEVLDGSMSLEARALVVRRFMQDPGLSVLLCTTRSAGQGLNLVAATRVILLDVWCGGREGDNHILEHALTWTGSV